MTISHNFNLAELPTFEFQFNDPAVSSLMIPGHIFLRREVKPLVLAYVLMGQYEGSRSPPWRGECREFPYKASLN